MSCSIRPLPALRASALAGFLPAGMAIVALLCSPPELTAKAEPDMKQDAQCLDIGDRLELFVGRSLVASMDGTRYDLQHPVPREVALQLDRPWEGPDCYDPCVFLDGARYRMYYRAMRDDRTPPRVGYAESTNGIQWVRPNLGLVDFAGATLRVNYSTSAAGSLRVALLAADGAPLAGWEQSDELYGDEIARVVTWKGRADLSALTGTPVRLRFELRDADLYAFQFITR